MEITIEFKLDVETLLRNNPRETLEIVIPRELHYYENTEKRYNIGGN